MLSFAGDSGGPLIATHPDPGNNEQVLLGILHGTSDGLDVFANLANPRTLQWIEDEVHTDYCHKSLRPVGNFRGPCDD